MNKVFDPIRKEPFSHTPEEKVRQKLIKKMVDSLGYPKGLIAVEQSIDTLDHVKDVKTNRRADIICFTKLNPIYPIYPLLLIECKATDLTEQVIRQVEGYNAIVKAYYFALVNAEKIYTCWKGDRGEIKKVDYLPPYKTLLKAAHG